MNRGHQVTEGKVVRVRSILNTDKLTRSNVEELVSLGSLGGELPPADGTGPDGQPYWLPETFSRWADRSAMHYRGKC